MAAVFIDAYGGAYLDAKDKAKGSDRPLVFPRDVQVSRKYIDESRRPRMEW